MKADCDSPIASTCFGVSPASSFAPEACTASPACSKMLYE